MAEFRVSGFHSVNELILKNPGAIQRIVLTGSLQDLSEREKEALKIAKKRGIPCVEEQGRRAKNSTSRSAEDHDALSNVGKLIALISTPNEFDLDEAISDFPADKPVILAVDGITDPQNLGSLIRSAAVLGVQYLLMPSDRTSPLTETVYKIASGGMEHVKVIRVANLVQALETLKTAGYWVIGLSEHAEQTTRSMVVDFPAVIVIGNEEKGIRPLVHKTCDFWVKIAGSGSLLSLNASIAGAIAMEWALTKKSK